MNNFKSLPVLLLFAWVCLTTQSWSQGWQQKANFGGSKKANAFSFVIGSKAYFGTGLNANFTATNDFWEYNPATDSWTQRANFIGQASYGAVAFAIGTKGYVGTGASVYQIGSSNFYEYDPVTNVWKAKASLGNGQQRYGAVGFAIGSKGYIGLGRQHITTFKSDFWEYNPVTNKWTQKASYPAGGCVDASAFEINGKGYVGMGISASAQFKVLYEFNPANNTWTRKADLPSIPRSAASAMVINSKGYILLGSSNTPDVWEYNPVTNQWKQRMNFSGAPRKYASAFAINGKGYVTGGNRGNTFFNDVWEYSSDSCKIVAVATTRVKPSLCSADSIQITTNPDTGLTYQWRLNGVDIPGETNKSYYAKQVGLYTVKIDGKFICANTSIGVRVIKPCGDSIPLANAGNDIKLCADSIAQLNGSISGTATSATWSGGTGTFSPDANTVRATYIPSAADIAAGTVKLFLTTNDPDSTGPLTASIDSTILSISNGPAMPASITGFPWFCANSSGNVYSIPAIPGTTFSWAEPEGSMITSGQGTNTIIVSYDDSIVSDTIFVSGYNTCGTSQEVSLLVSRNTALPTMPGLISGPVSGCAGDKKKYSIRKITDAEKYIWTPPAGSTINGSAAPFTTADTTVSISLTSSFAGDQVKVRSLNCSGVSSDQALMISKKLATQPGAISGAATICNGNSYVYSIQKVTDADAYVWTPPAGATIKGSTAPYATTDTTVTVVYTTAFTGSNLKVKASTCNAVSADKSLMISKKVSTQPGLISGAVNVCNGGSYLYSIQKLYDADAYVWTPPAGSTINGSSSPFTTTDTTVTIVYTTAFNGDNLKVKAKTCTAISADRTLMISKRAVTQQPAAITGTVNVCNGNSYVYSINKVYDADAYVWTPPAGATINGSSSAYTTTDTSVTVVYTSAFTGDNLKVKASTCNVASADRLLMINKRSTTQPGAIAGVVNVCNGNSFIYSINKVYDADAYVWTPPAGATINGSSASYSTTDTSVTVVYTTAFTGDNLKVKASTCNTTSADRTLMINKRAATQPLAITGNVNICNGISYVYSIYKVYDADAYVWTPPAGATINGSSSAYTTTDTSVTVVYTTAFTGDNLKVKVSTCNTTSADRTLMINKRAATQPLAITGNVNICNGNSYVYSINKVYDADAYVWTPPAGASIHGSSSSYTTTDTSVTVVYTSTFTGDNLKVKVSTCNATSADRSLMINKRAATQPLAITGNVNICNGNSYVYSINKVYDADAYVWTPPAGASIHGSSSSYTTTDTSVTVVYTSTFTGDNLKVKVSTCNATSADRTLMINKRAATQPLAIAGNVNICNGNSYVYSINKVYDADAYVWTPPAGATINGSSSAYTATDTSVTVVYTSAFIGDNLKVKASTCNVSSADRLLMINKKVVAQPGAIAGNVNACNGNNYVYSINKVTGADAYVWTPPTGATINGSSASFTTTDTTVTVVYTSAFTGDNLKVKASTCTSTSADRLLMINKRVATQPGVITGVVNVCGSNSFIYSINKVTGADAYVWTPPTGATIKGSSSSYTTTDTAVTVVYTTAFTGDNLKVKTSTCNATSADRLLMINKRVATQPGAIAGTVNVCGSNSFVYSINKVNDADAYVWTPPAGATIKGSSSPYTTTDTVVTVVYTTSFTGDNLKVKASTCNTASADRLLLISKKAATQPGAITGNVNVCNGNNYVYSIRKVPNADSYIWTPPSGAKINGYATAFTTTDTTVTVSYTTSFNGDNLKVKTLACNAISADQTLMIGKSVATQPGTITGNVMVCNGNSYVYSIQKVPTADAYIWTPPAGATIKGSSSPYTTTDTVVTVSFTSAFNGTSLKVRSSTCGVLSRNRRLKIGKITPEVPGAISGRVTACPGDTVLYSIQKVAGADFYIWTPPTGATINNMATSYVTADTVIKVVFNALFSGDKLYVKTSTCSLLSNNQSLMVNKIIPAKPGAITGPEDGLCNQPSISYTISPVSNATSYTWRTNILGSAINSSSLPVTTSNLSVIAKYGLFNNGTIYVKANNTCGSSAESNLDVSAIPVAPASITGSAVVCVGQTGEPYSTPVVQFASSYNWDVSSGSNIVTGQNTNAVTVNFKSNGNSGSVRVRSVNACGSSAYNTLNVKFNRCARLAGDEIGDDERLALEAYPVPAHDNITLNVIAPADENYLIEITDLYGRLLLQKDNFMSKGENRLQLDLKSFIQGNYIITVHSDKHVSQLKFVVQ